MRTHQKLKMNYVMKIKHCNTQFVMSVSDCSGLLSRVRIQINSSTHSTSDTNYLS